MGHCGRSEDFEKVFLKKGEICVMASSTSFQEITVLICNVCTRCLKGIRIYSSNDHFLNLSEVYYVSIDLTVFSGHDLLHFFKVYFIDSGVYFV